MNLCALATGRVPPLSHGGVSWFGKGKNQTVLAQLSRLDRVNPGPLRQGAPLEE